MRLGMRLPKAEFVIYDTSSPPLCTKCSLVKEEHLMGADGISSFCAEAEES